MTDGYIDQFGGPKDKKFKAAALQKLLLEIHQKALTLQKDQLETTFKNWKGSLEQVDDITIIGLRV